MTLIKWIFNYFDEKYNFILYAEPIGKLVNQL